MARADNQIECHVCHQRSMVIGYEDEGIIGWECVECGARCIVGPADMPEHRWRIAHQWQQEERIKR